MSNIIDKIKSELEAPVSPAPLSVFRVLFGFIMAVSVLRFILNGWIEQFYIEPEFHFKYFGFHWVADPGATILYVLFAIMVVSSLLIMIGYKYKLAAITFFISFTYVELIDITYYLNHYYFVSLVSFIMIFLPANRYFALDTKKSGSIETIPRWIILFLQLQLFIVYFYAGLAKLNYDWLVNAMPLKIWIQAHSDLPLIGSLMTKEYTAYIFIVKRRNTTWSNIIKGKTTAIYNLSFVYCSVACENIFLNKGSAIFYNILKL